MRRRALLASQVVQGGGGGDWSYELHLTPEWEEPIFPWEPYTVYISGDFIQLYEFLCNMSKTLGYTNNNYYTLEDIPQECNITVDGFKLSIIDYSLNAQHIEATFGSTIYGVISANSITFDKYD